MTIIIVIRIEETNKNVLCFVEKFVFVLANKSSKLDYTAASQKKKTKHFIVKIPTMIFIHIYVQIFGVLFIYNIIHKSINKSINKQ